MQAIRQIYQKTPSIIHINIPEELQNQPVEVIIIALDSYINKDIEIKETDSNGWPIGFFEATSGCLADDPIERAPQGDYETRLEME
ncbi:MAG: hypothetical protein NTY69_02845 [Methylococcales bacterium]|nr:hypothetical protein [Methylococcales bacterium]